jgi:alcohol dehydrogenase (cytochrome c)
MFELRIPYAVCLAAGLPWLLSSQPAGKPSDLEPHTPLVIERRVQTTDGQILEGRVLGEGLTDLQIQTQDKLVHLLRKEAGGRYRPVTSQIDWPTYDGAMGGNRYVTMTQIGKENVSRLGPKWTFSPPNVGHLETTPVVVDGMMYVTSVNECFALDAGTGRQIWHYQRAKTRGVVGAVVLGFNRGVAWRGDRIFMVTDHAHIIALNRFNGELLWETEMADWRQNYNANSAPLVVGSLVISGIAGGDEGVRGFVAAYDTATGKEAWRFWTVPKSGEPGSETWKGNTLEHSGGTTWMTGSYDPDLNLIYWAAGNPGSDFYGGDRQGDNLYTDSVVALEPTSGKLRWYYQFTPHDIHDWDAEEPPLLIDTEWHGQPRKLLVEANRNGFFYVIDRSNGKLLLARRFLKKLNWAERIGEDGKPVLKTLPVDADGDNYVCPGFQGATNWFSTSFNPITGLYYFQALERCNLFSIRQKDWAVGQKYLGGDVHPVPGEVFEKSLRAINIQSGETVWEIPQAPANAPAAAGVISTASGLVFFGENSGSFVAADAANGRILWQFPTNSLISASPMSYMFDNKEFIAIAAGRDVMAFALPD